ncbi:ATP-depentend DNA helicase-like protein [Westerdykella ornata]|uniref:DNA 3'-5' helicase n=1 Tax=Westerdykella ornata TaxID=318751 RepID=A0A6A6JSX5_WESOR|nr:ATP-depentend DNA helicase-like protein [Westerdykella ornata]KAF2279365.1 ATP-depentend DNA helicase-like protein [Westerdykella ornata]
MDSLLDGLNDAQKSAVTSPASVVQVLAPPGSGKTKTLTARVAYLINHEGLKPWNIVVCTFTIKAAREMKERIRGMVGEGVEAKLILGTFHSVARRFLVRYGQEIGIDKNFGIADTSDSTAIIKRIIQRGDYTLDPSAARSRISSLKAKGTTVDEFARTTKKAEQHEFTCVYSDYEDTLKASNLLDYDDLLLRCVELLRKHPACVSSIEAVLIDEYQDTNNVQYELMTLLAQKRKRITIVGDPDQSIYGFRSAEIKNLHRMQKDYPDSLVINLENNYRSSGCILSSAMAVIEQDESRPSKSLQATHCVGEQPTLRHLADSNVESDWIVEEIQRSRTLAAGLLDFHDYAILLRSASLSLSIESKLGKAGIPYRMVGGRRFFDRAEVKIILDYLRAIDQPHHNDALARVLNVPSRKIGEVTVKSLLEEAEQKKTSLWKLLHNAAKGGKRPATKISSQAQKGIDVFVNLILTSRAKLLPEDGGYCNLWDLITHVLQKISFEAYLKKTYPENWKDRWANIEELGIQATQMAAAVANGETISDDALPVVDGVEQREDTAADLLSKFLSNVALSTEVERPDGEEPNQVTISTIHAAKGLEWPVVFIPAVYEGSIPHSRAEDHNEERRLLYVGMTRAKALLYLSCPVKQAGQDETTLSSFLSSPDVQKLFSQTGPSIGCSAIADLARILRRPCPSSSQVEAARALLESVEDDKYPPTRDYIEAEGIPSLSFEHQPSGVKRRKLVHLSDGFTAATTMQSASSFSVATTTLQSGHAGFTTARTQHKILQEAKAVEPLVSASTVSAGNAAYRDFQRVDVEESKATRGRPQKPRAAGQGAITSFFKRPEPAASDTSAVSVTTPPTSLQTPGPLVMPVPSLLRSQSSGSRHRPLDDISNVPQRSNRTYQPPTMSNHRPRNAPMMSKPKKPAIESGEEDPSTRYILHSSSPVKPDDELALGQVEFEEAAEEPTSPITYHRKTGNLLTAGFRAASTLHTTTVAQVQSTTGVQRKTLGMRRSVHGWTVKHQQPPRPRQ